MWLMLLMLGSALLYPSSYAVRSVEELKLMTEPELARESRLVCLAIAGNLGQMRHYGASKEQIDGQFYLKALEEVKPRQQYLERIGLVVRDKHQGQMPAWFRQMQEAATSDDAPTAEKTCSAAALNRVIWPCWSSVIIASMAEANMRIGRSSLSRSWFWS